MTEKIDIGAIYEPIQREFYAGGMGWWTAIRIAAARGSAEAKDYLGPRFDEHPGDAIDQIIVEAFEVQSAKVGRVTRFARLKEAANFEVAVKREARRAIAQHPQRDEIVDHLIEYALDDMIQIAWDERGMICDED